MDFVSHFHGLRYFKLKLCYLSHFKSTTSCAGARMNMWSFNFSTSRSLISMFLLQPNVVGYLKRLSKFIKLLGIGGFKVIFAWDVFAFCISMVPKIIFFFQLAVWQYLKSGNLDVIPREYWFQCGWNIVLLENLTIWNVMALFSILAKFLIDTILLSCPKGLGFPAIFSSLTSIELCWRENFVMLGSQVSYLEPWLFLA